MHHFEKVKRPASELNRLSNNREVELSQLIPCVTGMLILDLNDPSVLHRRPGEDRIRLAPSSPILVNKVNPRPDAELVLRLPKRKQREVLFALSLVPNPDSKASAASLPYDKRWLLSEELHIPHRLRGAKFRWRWG